MVPTLKLCLGASKRTARGCLKAKLMGVKARVKGPLSIENK